MKSTILLLFLLATAVGCNTREYESALVPSSCFIDPQSWRAPSLTKEELKALDLKLRQEALIFHEGDRVVDRYPYSEGFCQTAIVLRVDMRKEMVVIQYEKSGLNSSTGTGWLIKIGEDYVEPKNYNIPFNFDILKSYKIDSFKVNEKRYYFFEESK